MLPNCSVGGSSTQQYWCRWLDGGGGGARVRPGGTPGESVCGPPPGCAPPDPPLILCFPSASLTASFTSLSSEATYGVTVSTALWPSDVYNVKTVSYLDSDKPNKPGETFTSPYKFTVVVNYMAKKIKQNRGHFLLPMMTFFSAYSHLTARNRVLVGRTVKMNAQNGMGRTRC